MMKIFTGVVEDRKTDPLRIGRCKVRVFGVHNPDPTLLKTEDLPWATLLQTTTSAAVSGIGHSPTGFVEGTWVLVTFADEEMQYPIILGSFAGVPQKNGMEISIPEGISDRITPPVDPVVEQPEPVVDQSSGLVQEAAVMKKPDQFSLQPDGAALIMQAEGLASLSKTKRMIGNARTPADTLVYSYLDTSNLWTIGWGSRYMPDGTLVTGDSVITKKQADDLFGKRLYKEFEAGVKRNCKVLLTQSMYDSLVSMAYNMGVAGLFDSEIGTSLNSGRYKEAAAFIPQTKTNKGVLTKRRMHEMELFLRDGIPDPSQGDIDVSVPPPIPPETRAEPKRPINSQRTRGFADFGGVYPLYFEEPDTNRLARGESLNQTVVYAKEAARTTGVKVARTKEQKQTTWDQPRIPYSAQYPYNHVYSSESGHIKEYDDTPGKERIHEYHRTGTFYEIDLNGTKVTRVVGDNYEILERNGYITITGNQNITIRGNSNVRIENSQNVEILGDSHIAVTGNCTQTVAGNYKMLVGGDFLIDATNIHLNSAKNDDLVLPSEGAKGVPQFSKLIVPNREADIDQNYEMPEEGSGATFNSTAITKGDIEDPNKSTEKEEPPMKESSVSKSPSGQLSDVCGVDIMEAKEFIAGFKLTDNTSLGAACVGESGIPTGIHYGTSAQQIVCNLKRLYMNCVEPIARKYPNIQVTSTWRSEPVNKKYGGQTKSHHLRGMAADFVLTGFNRERHYDAVQDIAKLLPAYTQLILEYKGNKTWIHVSYDAADLKCQCLTIDAVTNTTLKSGGFLLKG